MSEIKLSSNTIPNNHLEDLAEWLKTFPRLTKEKLTVQFEEKFANYINVQNSIFVNSGSSANLLLAEANLHYNDLRNINDEHEFVRAKQWKESGENEYENYKLEYVADIDYNSMILYPSHYWHNAYLKEDWFIDEDRVTFTGFFELVK